MNTPKDTETEKARNARKQKTYRQRRKAAALVQLRVWVLKADEAKALKAIHKFKEAGLKKLKEIEEEGTEE